MKSFTLLLATLIASTSFATTVKILMFIDNGKSLIPMSEINAKYKLQGANKFTEVLIINDTKESLDSARKIYWDLFQKIQDFKQASPELASDSPGLNSVKGIQTCYTGTPSEAVEIVSSMSDSIYSDQMGLWG